MTDTHMLALEAIRSRPHTSTPQKTWESCHEHFTCPNGEECWYLSEDYHNDQNIAIRNDEREKCIKILAGKFLEEVYPHGIPKFVDTEHDSEIPSIGIDVLSYIIESLRTPTQEQP